MALAVAYHVGTSKVYGNVVARSSFTPDQQRIMDQGGNYAGYAVVDGHFTYVGAGASGQDAYNRIYGAPAATAQPAKGSWMDGPAGYTGGTSTPTVPGTPAAAATSPTDDAAKVAKDAANQDALARIKDVLGQYGLDSLSGFVWQSIVSGMSETQVLQAIRETPQFQQRFPAIAERQKKGLPALSPGEYVAYEQAATQMMRAAGLPSGFYDNPDDFTKFLTADVSVKELSDRVDLARQAAYQAPAEVRTALRTQFGLGDGDLAAYFLDSNRAVPLLQRTYNAAQIAGVSARTGYGTTAEQDYRLADLGVGADQAQAGFSALAQQQELFNPLAGHNEGVITTDQQLAAAFAQNPEAQRAIERRRQERVAEFGGGGGYAGTQSGLSGIGSASGA